MLRNAARLFVTQSRAKSTQKNTSSLKGIQHLESDLFVARETIKKICDFCVSNKITLPKPIWEKSLEQIKAHDANKELEQSSRLNMLEAEKEKLVELHKIAIEQLHAAQATVKAEVLAIAELKKEVKSIEDEINSIGSLDEEHIDISSQSARDFARRRDL